MNKVKQELKRQLDVTGPLILNFPWENARSYADWLVQTYHMVCHSTRLVALAGAHCKIENAELHARFVDHSKEERGHDKVAIADLSKLGYKVDDFEQKYQSACMYQIQYYWIQFVDPVAFFGYTLALEALASNFGPQLHQKVLAAHGPQASRFLKLHSEDDVEHMESAFEQINQLNEKQQVQVIENLKISSELYRDMLLQLQNKNSLYPSKAA
jgi:hypothetical protein